MNRVYKRIVVLDGSVFPDILKVDDIASRIVDFFASVNVLSIQFMPGRAIRDNFESEPFAADVVRELCVTVDNVVCPVRGGEVGLDRKAFLFSLIHLRQIVPHLRKNFLNMGRCMTSALGCGLILTMVCMYVCMYVCI